jgi:hypothetical protein
MHIERFFVPGLAPASYLVASGSEAVVVDPGRYVEGYVAYLAKYMAFCLWIDLASASVPREALRLFPVQGIGFAFR